MNKTGKVSFKLFYLRRALRIWPSFYLVLTLASVLTAVGILSGHLASADCLAQCLHYSNYWLIWHGADHIPHGTAVYWSLAVEEHFYLILPALYMVLRRLNLSAGRQAAVFLGLCMLTLAWRTVLVVHYHPLPERTYLATDTRFDSMLFGCTLAVFNNPAVDLPKRDRPSAHELAFLVGGVLLLLISFLVRDPVFRETLRYSLQGLGLFPIFITAIRFPNWGPYRLLQLRFVRYVGTISFTLYLVHHVVIGALSDYGVTSVPVVLPTALAISLLFATVSWFGIEKPCAGLRRRLASVASAGGTAPARRESPHLAPAAPPSAAD
jgi:peptidoglycan/LPS O-acetylase OafA/YrhL